MKIKTGEINPQKLIEMNSVQRREFFSEFMGKQNAKEVNAAFEAKLLLKNQQRGIITWAQRVAGMKPEVKRDLISRVEKMKNVLQPEDQDKFLADLAEKRLGVEVSAEEAAHVAKLSENIEAAKAEMDAGGDRFKYGEAVVEFHNYVNAKKIEAEGRTGKEIAVDVFKRPVESLSKVAGFAKSIKASLDNSALGRQGLKTLFNHPKIWMKNAVESFANIARTVGGKDVMDAVNADIFSRPNYDLMRKAKLAIGNLEEAFPTELPEKIPGLGRLYKASQDSYTAFIQKTRADVFDKYIDIARKADLPLDKTELEGIGRMVNSITGRANVGRFEPAANVVNNVFFSFRWMVSHLDTLALGQLTLGKNATRFARKHAAIQALRTISGVGAILTIANAVNPDSVEWDARSSDFGKIKSGNTRFDVAAGMGAYVTLATRLMRQSTKSSMSGAVKPINTGKFGSQKGSDLIFNFFTNKFSPAFAFGKQLFDQKTFEGDPVTIQSALKDLFAPLPVTNAIESAKEPNRANLLLIMISDALGVSANTYSRKQTEAEKKLEEILKLPEEEQKPAVAKIKKENPPLFKLLMDEKEKHDLGITPQDEYVKTLGVKDQGRAMYIWDEIEGLEPEQQKEVIQGYKNKKVASDDVIKQLQEFKKEGGYEYLGLERSDKESAPNLYDKTVGALITDPKTTLKAAVSKEKIKKVEGGVVQLERIIGQAESNRIKKERGYGKVIDEVSLEHVIPLQIGGDNSDGNLMVIPDDLHDSYTEFDNLLGKKVKSGEMKRKEAQKIMKQVKVDQTLSLEDALKQYK